MVGEIRDGETAEIAVQSALTGHMVFSTLHTNDAAGALTRLLEMGIEPFLVASAIDRHSGPAPGAQNLPRLPRVLPAERRNASGDWLANAVPSDAHFYRGTGCPSCMGIGYRGRTGIYELLPIDEEIRELLLQNGCGQHQECGRPQRHADPAGCRPGQSAAGETTLEEVLRVTQEEG